jgi:PAS domain S-box-containing protein/putative nucleotidyltransferase with HDIG domain
VVRETAVVLIVDDSISGCRVLESLLERDGYGLYTANSGVETLAKVKEIHPDLILLDVMMPGMDGFEVCRHLRAEPEYSEVPIIMVTALDDRDSRLEGINAGADDFISKPVDRAELRARVRTITRLNRYRNLLMERSRYEGLIDLLPDGLIITETSGMIRLANRMAASMLPQSDSLIGKNLFDHFDAKEWMRLQKGLDHLQEGPQSVFWFEGCFQSPDRASLPVEIHAGMIEWNHAAHYQMVIHDISERKRSEEQLAQAYSELEVSLEETIEGWARALELKDQETGAHNRRVADWTMKMATWLGFDETRIKQIRRGAYLHDIGKIGIPDSVLLKPGPLTPEEWVIMRRHTEYGARMISAISYLKSATAIPLCHHENWDGSGYPKGLKGEDIPLEARIFTFFDVFDAITSNRVYNRAESKEVAIEFIRSQSGIKFDPRLVEFFVEMMG